MWLVTLCLIYKTKPKLWNLLVSKIQHVLIGLFGCAFPAPWFTLTMCPLSSLTRLFLSSPSNRCKKCIYTAVSADQRLSELSHSHVLLYFFISPSSPLSSLRAAGSNVQVRCRRCPPLTPPLPMRNTSLLRPRDRWEQELRGKTAAWKWPSGARPANGFRRAITLSQHVFSISEFCSDALKPCCFRVFLWVPWRVGVSF